jgi:outer membrane protein assembly factor BamB
MLRLTALGIACGLVWSAAAQHIGWRTDGFGHYPEATVPPAWSATEAQVWKTPIKGFSNATPLLVGQQLFVLGEPYALYCLNAADGTIRWQADNSYEAILGAETVARLKQEAAPRIAPVAAQIKELEPQLKQLRDEQQKDKQNKELRNRLNALQRQRQELDQQLSAADPLRPPGTHGENGFSSYSPVSDGQRVYVFFGNGVLAAYDLAGKRLWGKVVDKPTHGWGQSSSPVLADGKLLLHVAAMVAYDPATGEELWRTPSEWGWGTPAVTRLGDTPIVITPKGDAIRASDGKRLATKLGRLEFASPLVADGVVYFIEAKSCAVKLPASADEPFPAEPLWRSTLKGDRHYSSPLLHDGLLYAISRKGEFSLLEAATGKLLLEQAVDCGRDVNTFYCSPTLVGQHILVGAMNGETVVLQPGRECRELRRNCLEPYRTTPIAAGSRLFLRGTTGVYCFGQ